MKKHIKNLFLLAAICLTVACKEQLYTGLTEKEANQMQALLLSMMSMFPKKWTKVEI